MSTHEHGDKHPTGSWDEPEKAPDTTADEDAIMALARRESSELAAQGESLPVLEAFQEFLEAERLRSRRRIIILSTAFSAVLLVVIVGGVFIGASMLRPIHDNYRNMQSDINAFDRATANSRKRIDGMLDRFGKQDRRLREELAKERQSSAETRQDLSQKSKQFENDVTRMQKLMGRLHAHNRELRKSIEEQNERIPSLVAEAERSMREPDTANVTDVAARPEAPYGEGSGQGRRETLTLSIMPKGYDQSVAWRVPIPE
jgi:hypothetical protein